MTKSNIRTRFNSTLQTVGTRQEWAYHTSCSHTSWTANGVAVPYYSGKVETMTDVVTSNFRERRAKGELFFNSMSQLKSEYIAGGGIGFYIKSIPNTCASPAWKAEYEGRGDWITAFIPMTINAGKPVPNYNGILTADDESRLATEASTAMLNERGRADLNLWETVAELNKSFAMVNRPVSKLHGVLDKALKAKSQGRLSRYTARGMADLYLLWRYGIVPLVSDIEGAWKGLQTSVAVSKRATVRAKRKISEYKQTTSSTQLGVLNVTVTNYISHACEVRAMSLDEFDVSLANNLGFTTKGLLTLPWELTGYSFVADWFLNIGEFIGAMVPAFGWNQLGSAMTITHVVTNTYVITGATCTSPTYTLTRSPTGSYVVRVTGKRRVPVATPEIVIKSDFKFDNATRLADSLSLLAQKMVRVFK